MFQKSLLVLFFAVFLSGCTLTVPGTTPSAGAPTKGSIWKSSDAGLTFEVKSTIDEKTTIAKADILSIAYHPNKPGTVYVGSIENGIFKTENGGEEWTPISFPPKKIYSFILDKNNPDTRMFASGVVGDWGKIFRTDDGGEEWKPVYTEPGQKISVTALAQHPTATNIIFAGTSSGTAIKSVDSGETWKNVGQKIDGIISDVLFDATDPQVTYLVTFGQKVYYSIDQGLNWLDWEAEKQKEPEALQKIANERSITGDIDGAERARKESQSINARNMKGKMPMSIVVAASDPLRSGVLYVGTNTGLFKSEDYGKYWTEINIIESAKQFPIRSIAVNPKTSSEIVFVSGKAFYKSTDGGETWVVTGFDVDRGASFVSYDPFDSRYLFVGLRNFK